MNADIVTQYETWHDRRPTHPILPEWLYRAREASVKAWQALDKHIDLDYHYDTWDQDYHLLLEKAIRMDMLALRMGSAYHSGIVCECKCTDNCYLCSLINMLEREKTG